MSKKILVISSCTGQKTIHSTQALTLADFRSGESVVQVREQSWPELLTEACKLYSGQQHLRLMRGIREAEEAGLDIGLQILSAGYGLVDSQKKIFPYEVTFNGMNKRELLAWANQRNIPADFSRIIAQPYDLALILLGDSYLEACQWDENIQLGGPTLLFCGSSAANRLPRLPQLNIITLSNKDAKRFSCGLVGLKGEVAARAMLLLSKEEELPANAEDLLQKLETVTLPREPKNKTSAKPKSALHILPPDPKVDWIIQIPERFEAAVHHQRLQYFIPEWDDLVDPNYNFLEETHSGGTADWSNEVFAHQIYPYPNYDGILISREVIEGNTKKRIRLNQFGVHRYCRVPREFPIMGDCGAFGYVGKEKPPYSTQEMLDYYTRLDFDLGVSIDHLVFGGKNEQERLERYQLTVHNAEEFLRGHQQQGLNWTPIGAVQGYDINSYAKAAEQYVRMGYQYIALGGLVRSKTMDVLKIVEEVVKVVPKSVRIHLFGLARLDASRVFSRLGITSVDSASHLRKAWMGAKDNYWTLDGKHYAAVRVPEVGKSPQAMALVRYGIVSEAALREIEEECLQALREYDREKIDLEEVLDVLQVYDLKMVELYAYKEKRKDQEKTNTLQKINQLTIFNQEEKEERKGRASMMNEYRRILEEMPWKKCPCAICHQHGIEVVIFRGNNRNRRRGFHNTYVFYELLNRTSLNDTYFINTKHQEFEAAF